MDADESLLTNGYLERTVIDWIPGLPPIRLSDVSSFLRTTDLDDFCLCFNESEANRCTTASALILNTFEGLEADVLASLRAEYPRVYTVGPLGTLLRRTLNGGGGGLSLWKQDAECVAWLDTQEQGSVVYVNFGSHTVVTPEQLAEFAWGLAATGHPFLWAIRDNLIRGDGGGGGRRLALEALPAGFTAEMARRCRLTRAVVPAGAGAAARGRGLLPDARRVELGVRERHRRRADGVLAGVRGPVHQL